MEEINVDLLAAPVYMLTPMTLIRERNGPVPRLVGLMGEG